jgi:hypothetical protein
MLGAGVLLLLDTFFAWQKVSVEIGGTDVASATLNAWHGFFGVVLGLLTLALLVWLGLRIAGVDVPVTLPEPQVTLALGALVFLFALLKNLFDDYSARASYVGVVLAAAVAAGAY